MVNENLLLKKRGVLPISFLSNHLKNFFAIFGRLKRKILAFWEKYVTAYGKSVKDGYKSNAYSPLVWFLVFLLPLLIIITLVVKNPVIQYIFVGLIVLTILFSLVIYVVLLVKDPKLLQSEWYRLEDKKLTMIAEQGDAGTRTIESITTTQVTGIDE